MQNTSPLRGLAAIGAGLALAAAAEAQLTQPGEPVSTWAELSADVPTLILPSPDVQALLEEDQVTGPFPLRYGVEIDTSAGLLDGGLWETVEDDGSLVWRLRIESPGAHSLGVTFSQYQIPVGGQVFLYNDRGDLFGAYTDANNNVNGYLGIQPVAGDALTVEYVQQSWVTDAPKLHVGTVIHDYKDVFNMLEVVGDPAGSPGDGCGLVGINCPEGASYQTVKRSVMRTLAGGSLCSASLMNNTSEDGTPYMLTANHCGFMGSAQFLFNYEQASCGTSFGPTNNVISGAQQLAASGTYDSQLYRLNTTPPASFNVHWAGWDRANGTSAPATTIGHGGGGPKNMAIDNSGAQNSGSDWQVFWNTGYIIGGNSGGPLFNGFQRVIGPACCVSNFSCGSQTAWYGRFDLFWNNFNLGQWLDPTGTGTISLDGTSDPGGPGGGTLAVDSITPSTIEALNVGTDQFVTITGSGFTPQSTIEINGVEMFGVPSPFTYVNSSTITFDPPDPGNIGLSVVTVKNGTQSEIGLMTVTQNATPALQAGTGDDPVTVIGGNVTLKCAAPIGESFIILGSTSNVPTSAPGFFSLGIGNNFTNLFALATVTIENDGITSLNLSTSGLPPATTFFVEGLSFNGVSLPLADSNTQEIFHLF